MPTFNGGLDAARTILQDRFGHARFRIHQLKVLGPLLAGRNVLAVLPTGAGKSLCYQVPAFLGTGLTLVISPLISLMQDQVGALRRRGIAAAYVNSHLDAGQRRVVLDAATSGRLAMLYCAPERLGSLTRRLASGDTHVSLLAIDEAHCITEWGNEFRPVYRRLGMFRSLLGRPPTIALTGSATPAARADILHVLRMPDAEVVVASFDRPNLTFTARRVRDDRERFALIRERVRDAPGASLIYTPTRRLTELVARALLRTSVITPGWRQTRGGKSCAPSSPIAFTSLWRRAPSGWGSTNRMCGKYCTGDHHRRSKPTIRRRAGRAAMASNQNVSFCGGRRTWLGETSRRRCGVTSRRAGTTAR